MEAISYNKNMYIFKSTIQTIVNPRTLEMDYIYMHIKPVIYDGVNFTAPIRYFRMIDVQISEDPITLVPVMRTYPRYLPEFNSQAVFSRAECEAIQQAVPGGLQGTSFPGWYDQLIMTGIFYQLSVQPVFAVNASQWVQVPNSIV